MDLTVLVVVAELVAVVPALDVARAVLDDVTATVAARHVEQLIDRDLERALLRVELLVAAPVPVAGRQRGARRDHVLPVDVVTDDGFDVGSGAFGDTNCTNTSPSFTMPIS